MRSIAAEQVKVEKDKKQVLADLRRAESVSAKPITQMA